MSRKRLRSTSWMTSFFLLLLLLLLLMAPPTGTIIFERAAAAEKEVPAEMQTRAEAVFARVMDALAAEHDVADEYSIQVVHERVPNAWINQDYEVYVSTGLMELLTTDDQLGGVIGHEIAHGMLGHIPHRVNQSLWSAFAVLALGTVASTSGEADWGGLLHMRDLFMYAYNREQESEADLVGMGYARAAGYEPEGLVEALQLMDRERRSLPSDSVWQDLYRTHPPIPQRVSDLNFVLMTERLRQAPVQSATLTPRTAASSSEEAAVSFARALLSGDVDTVERLLLPGGALEWRTQFDNAFGTRDDFLDAEWVEASAETVIIDKGGGGSQTLTFDETLIVRLSRPDTGGDDGEMLYSPKLIVTVRRSATGWFVAGWQLDEG